MDAAPVTSGTALRTSTGTYGTAVENGTYDVYIGGADTDWNVTVSDGDGSAAVDYYTVGFSVTDAGVASGSTIAATESGNPVSNGAALLAGKTILLTATGAGGAATYTYAWTGSGTAGEITNSITVSPLAAAINAVCTVTGYEYTFVSFTGQATDINTNGMVLTGVLTLVNNTLPVEYGFAVGLGNNPTIGGPDAQKLTVDRVTAKARGVLASLSVGVVGSRSERTTAPAGGLYTYSITLGRLKSGTTYFVRAYALSGAEVSYGKTSGFTTKVMPLTGDDGLSWIWWLLGGGATAGIVALLIGSRRRKPE